MSACNCYYPLILYLADENVPAKILSYNRANRAVAILCNHQRAPPKTFEKSMQNLQTKVRLWLEPVERGPRSSLCASRPPQQQRL